MPPLGVGSFILELDLTVPLISLVWVLGVVGADLVPLVVDFDMPVLF